MFGLTHTTPRDRVIRVEALTFLLLVQDAMLQGIQLPDNELAVFLGLQSEIARLNGVVPS